MKSKLLQKISHSVDQSREVVNGQEDNTEDSPLQWRGRGTSPKPAVDAEARRDFPAPLKRSYRPARS
jgi:hypothetical protein